MSVFTGSAVAMVTPFRNGVVDRTALERLIELQIVSGTDAIVICGTTGEASTMSLDERLDTIRLCVERVEHRIPVIAGTGGNNTAEVIEMTRAAEAIGVNAALVVTPYYNKTSQEGLIAHYREVSDSVDIPIIAYNIPSRTGVNILPETMARIAESTNVVAVKEASGNIQQIVTMAACCPELDIYSGNDDHILPILSIGGKGVISTVANVMPEAVHNLCESFFKGDNDAAREAQIQLIPLCRAAFCEVNPIPIKTMLGMMKLCSPELRLPLVPPSADNKKLILDTMQAYRLIY